MAVHQVVPSFSAGDATGQSALHLKLLLRRMGHAGELYAVDIRDGLDLLVHRLSALRPKPDDLVLVHHAIGSELAARLMHLPCKRGIVYHNITPERFYPETPLVPLLRAGRAQLSAMAEHVDLAIGVSEFNAAELRTAGHHNVHVVPLFIEPERFARDRADIKRLSALEGPSPSVLFVSRVVAHKRFEHLLALHRELLALRPDAQLRLVGGYGEGEPYFKALRREAASLPNVHFLGRLHHAELVAAYRASSMFVSMSEHEGFGVPLLEAMASDLPVAAFAAGAVRETLGGAGIAFDEKNFSFLAELVVEVTENAALRNQLLKGQRRRLEELSADAAQAKLADALSTVLPPRPRRVAKKTAARPKVGVIVQRFGEVTGGAEKHAEELALHLAPHWDITVLTTCAKDHLTWANELAPGLQEHRGLRVHRFATTQPRDMERCNRVSRGLFGRSLERVREEQWVAEQGPLVPSLLAHLSDEGHTYDGFVGFTYLYTLMAWGLPLIGPRTLVVPTAHDEPAFDFGVYADVFERPHALMCNTPEERALIARRFPRHARAEVVGVGVESPAARPPRFAKKHGISHPYFFYVGRVEKGKGIPELIRFHEALRAEHPSAPDLLLAGDASTPVSGRYVRHLGRISDEDKFDAIAGAAAVIVPSRYESLSLLALEGFAQGTPLIGNADSEVLRGQVERSGAGATYRDAQSFIAATQSVLADRERLSKKARAFAAKHSWETVVSMYRNEMQSIMRGKP